MPQGWEAALALIARIFHPSFADLWAMDVEELMFWHDRAVWVIEQEHRKR